MRPYELPRPSYALWFDVGQRFGPHAQSVVAGALCDGTNCVRTEKLINGLAEVIKQMARERAVLLHFN